MTIFVSNNTDDEQLRPDGLLSLKLTHFLKLTSIKYINSVENLCHVENCIPILIENEGEIVCIRGANFSHSAV